MYTNNLSYGTPIVHNNSLNSENIENAPKSLSQKVADLRATGEQICLAVQNDDLNQLDILLQGIHERQLQFINTDSLEKMENKEKIVLSLLLDAVRQNKRKTVEFLTEKMPYLENHINKAIILAKVHNAQECLPYLKNYCQNDMEVNLTIFGTDRTIRKTYKNPIVTASK